MGVYVDGDLCVCHEHKMCTGVTSRFLQGFQFGANRVFDALGAFQFSHSRVVAGGMFAYSFVSANEDPDSTFWFSKFYGTFEFAGMTLKPAEPR
jgi:hypothetical protein